jgi:rSAM/selenodomain-associated transferase 2
VSGSISVVIPVRNDAEALARTLEHLTIDLPAGTEIVVAAAGPRTEIEQAACGRAQLIWPEASTRARLMNAGARVARGEILFFLHADSYPPRAALASIATTLDDPGVVGGAFEHQFAERVWKLRLLTYMNRIRYRLTRNYYGDQGIFVRAHVFHAVGGYPDQALLEDLALSQRLRRLGRYVLVRAPLVTSGRRFLVRGPWRTSLLIGWLLLLHTLRLSTERYAERWRGPAHLPPGSPWP